MIVKQYDHYVLELKEYLMQIINTKGKFLVVADTGGGKTYAILTIFKELSRLNTNKVYVIACPNRSQNEQNEKSYSVYAVVGGKAIDEGVLVASMVYDKAKEMKDYIIKDEKELVLVVDEAHQIIDSCIFRKNALQHLKELESISTTVIHLTATPEKLLHLYKYDSFYVFKPKNNKTNIKNHSLIILDNNDIIAQFLHLIKEVHSKNTNVPLIFLNNLGFIKECYKELVSKGFNVGIVANDDKLKEKFNLSLYPNLMKDREKILESVRSKSLIPNEYDFIFTTDIISCGINLLNTDIIMINALFSPLDIDAGNIKQRTSRPRLKIDEAFTIVRDVEEQKAVKDKTTIFNAVQYAVKKYQREYQELFDYEKNKFGLNVAVNHMQSILQSDINKNLYYSALEIEGDKIVINPVILVQAKFKEYHKQFYFNHEKLNNLLKENIKADEFTVMRVSHKLEKTEQNKIKEIRKEINEEKDDIKKQARKILLELKEDANLLDEYLNNTDIFTDLPKDLQKNIKILKAEKSILKLLKELLIENIPIKKAIEIVLTFETRKKVKEFIKRHNYTNRNIMGDPLVANDEYTIYRKIFDEVMKKQGRFSKDKIIELIKKCIICKIKKGKEREFCINLINELKTNESKYNELREIFELLAEGKSIPKEKGVSKANTTKLLKPLVIIYNLSKDRKGYKISSLKVDVNS